MSSKLKIISFSFVGVILVAAIIGWFIWNKPHKDVKDAVAVKTTAEELYNSFLKDSVAAKTKYTNKIVDIYGEVTQVNKNQQDQAIVLLNTDISNASVNCTMEGNADNIKPGDKVSIKGICNGYNGADTDLGIPGDVLLVRCYVTN